MKNKQKATDEMEAILADRDFVAALYEITDFIKEAYLDKGVLDEGTKKGAVSNVLKLAGVDVKRLLGFSAVLSSIKTLESKGYIQIVTKAKRLANQQYKESKDMGMFLVTKSKTYDKKDDTKNS